MTEPSREELAAYGAVLDPDWSSAVEQTSHPIDGTAVFATGSSTPTASGTLLLLHGVGNDGSIFAPVMSSLTSLGHVVAPTMSPELLTDVGDERRQITAKLVDWMAAVAPPPWRIVGHSMGGVMAGLVLRTRPDLVTGAVLLNAPLPGVVDRIRTRDTIDRTGRALLFMKALATVTRFGRPRLPRLLRRAEIAAVRVALGGFVHDPGDLDDRVLSKAILGSRTADGDRFLQLAEQLPRWEAEPFHETPVAIVLGDTDPLIPVEDVDEVVDAYPSAPVHVLAGCGHFAHLEWPLLTVDAITEFFGCLPAE